MNKPLLPFTIHFASVEDVPAIRQIAVFTWWTVYPSILGADQIEYMLDVLYNEGLLSKLISENEQQFLVLSEDDTPEAFASFGPLSESPETYKLYKLYILPQKHYKGFGKALIQKVVDIARENGIKYLQLNVNRSNQARYFYEKLGFRIIREEDIPIGKFWMNDYIMLLNIEKDWKF